MKSPTISKGDIVSVNFNNVQYTLCSKAEVLYTPASDIDSWIFKDLQTGDVHHVSEACTVTRHATTPPEKFVDRPKVGVGVFVFNDKKRFLLGKRQGAHGEGEWSLPGGHLEKNESFKDCCQREVEEETGIKIHSIEPLDFTNDIFEKEQLHYVTLFFTAQYESGKVQLMEPDKCSVWGWFSIDHLPQPIFSPLDQLIKKHS